LPQKKISVLQSIGQSGIVGKSEFNKTIIQQGFLTNTKYFSIDNSNVVNFEERFDVVVSPNPFIDYIKIDFSSKTKHPINIRIYDISGKTYIYKTYNASESILLPMKNFSLGNYIVHIVSGKNKYIKKIFKAQ
jgi:hypothetical protein